MRTTLDLDEDVLLAVKELAQTSGASAGKIVSGLVRKALERPAPAARVRNGVPLLPPRAPGSPLLALELIKQLAYDE